MIAIVDYGVGNLASVQKAFDRVGVECAITTNPAEVARAHKIVLPGVGHFAATSTLAESGLDSALLDRVRAGTPFLGICVGMQWMFESSEEAPAVRGAGLFSGACAHFPASVKSPHVGWNRLRLRSCSRLLPDPAAEPFVYFTHSYRAPVIAETTAECEYGGAFSAVVERGHVFGVQFHPEKSGEVGLELLKNFCAL